MKLAEILDDFKQRNIQIELMVSRSDKSRDNACSSCEKGNWELDHSETITGGMEKVEYYTCKNTCDCAHISTAIVRYFV